MQRLGWVALAVVFLMLAAAPAALAEKRIALLIGNKDYKPGVGALVNPLNDVRLVGEALKVVGFEVLKPAQNVRRAEMLRALYEFAAKLKAAGPDAVGFLYYSGHGIASAGENYLIPVDVDEPSTVELSVQGVKQSEVLAILRNEAPNAAHYLVLDACRNTLQGARGGKGFLPVGQQSGVLVAFAAEPGKTASDTGQGSGPYAAALAAELVKPGQSDLIMFHHVRVAVLDKTNGDQVPWTEDGIQRRERVLFGGDGKSSTSSQLSELKKQEVAATQPINPKPPPEPPQKPPANQSAWVKLCDDEETQSRYVGKSSLGVCLTHHERLDGNSGNVLVSVAVRQIEGHDKQYFMVMVPPGMQLQPGMRVSMYPKDQWELVQKNEKVDETKLKTLKLNYTQCQSTGCTAESETTPELINELKTFGGMVIWAINASGQPVGFPVPLVGFADALAGPPMNNQKYTKARQALIEQIKQRAQQQQK
jgi:invasion protein IalB